MKNPVICDWKTYSSTYSLWGLWALGQALKELETELQSSAKSFGVKLKPPKWLFPRGVEILTERSTWYSNFHFPWQFLGLFRSYALLCRTYFLRILCKKGMVLRFMAHWCALTVVTFCWDFLLVEAYGTLITSTVWERRQRDVLST